jgi:XTP/dITP diphosphohydrolase
VTPLARLLIATTNAGKVAEFRALMGDAAIYVDDLSQKTNVPEIEETGSSFLENAQIKAAAYALRYDCWALADDSGLCIDALAGKPGIYSARWAAKHDAGEGDAANNRLVLDQLKDVEDEQRTARFMCALAVSDEEGRIVMTCQDSVEGRLLREPRGSNGFGYDPLFFVESHGKTSAEMTGDEKHAISHRGKAMRTMAQLLRDEGLIV